MNRGSRAGAVADPVDVLQASMRPRFMNRGSAALRFGPSIGIPLQ